MFEMLAKERSRFKLIDEERFSGRYEKMSGILEIALLRLIYQSSDILPDVNNNIYVR